MMLTGEGEEMGRTWVVGIEWGRGNPSLWNGTLFFPFFVKLFLLFLWYCIVLYSEPFNPSSLPPLQRWVSLRTQFLYLTLHFLSCIVQVHTFIRWFWTRSFSSSLPLDLQITLRILLSLKICCFKTIHPSTFPISPGDFHSVSDSTIIFFFLFQRPKDLGVRVIDFQGWDIIYSLQAFAHHPVSSQAGTCHSWANLAITKYFFTCSQNQPPVTPSTPFPLFHDPGTRASESTERCVPKIGPLLFFQPIFKSVSLKTWGLEPKHKTHKTPGRCTARMSLHMGCDSK